MLLHVQGGLIGTAKTTYDNGCVQCILNTYDFCTQYSKMLNTTTGKCCSTLIQEGDYCNAGYPYCTVNANNGTKYYYCARDTYNASTGCGDYTFYLSSTTTDKNVIMNSYKVCEYTFSTPDAAAASNA